MEVWSFLDGHQYRAKQYKDILAARPLEAVKKVLGRELVFDDLTYNTVELCVKNWKETPRSATL